MVWFCEIKKKLAYFSTIVIFCYYHVALPLLHYNLDRGAISMLAIGAIYAPGAFLSEISGKYVLCTTIRVSLTANLPEEGI